jgi:molybdopterin synthase catalytic subunit
VTVAEWVRVQEEPFSIAEEIERLCGVSRTVGGIATFLGVARDLSAGRPVAALHFEHYGAMAEKELGVLREAAMERFDLIGLSVVHRVGDIALGEPIVAIVAAAEHRGPAFDACRWMIDELKRRVPIWKKEIGPGGASWVTPHP